jgi:hypothetical protein
VQRATLERLGLGLIAGVSWSFFGYTLGSGEFDQGLLLTALSGLGAWFWSEIRPTSEIPEVVEQSGFTRTYSKNDVRVARGLAKAASGALGYLLNDHMYWSWLSSGELEPLKKVHRDWKRGILFFQDVELSNMLDAFMEDEQKLIIKLATDTAPQDIFGEQKIGYKPFNEVNQEHYDSLLRESRNADRLASSAGIRLERIVDFVRKEVPEAFDEPLNS